MVELPPPPEEPAFETTPWPRGDPLTRVHSTQFGGRDFNPGFGQGRWHPFRGPDGVVVPTLYAGADYETALFEAPFRYLPSGATFFSSWLRVYARTAVMPRRSLTLIDLYESTGLKRLGVTAALVHSLPESYPQTVAWSRALHRASASAGVHGMIWRSPQRPEHDSLVFWGDRLHRDELREITPAARISHGELRARALTLAVNHGIVITADE